MSTRLEDAADALAAGDVETASRLLYGTERPVVGTRCAIQAPRSQARCEACEWISRTPDGPGSAHDAQQHTRRTGHDTLAVVGDGVVLRWTPVHAREGDEA